MKYCSKEQINSLRFIESTQIRGDRQQSSVNISVTLYSPILYKINNCTGMVILSLDRMFDTSDLRTNWVTVKFFQVPVDGRVEESTKMRKKHSAKIMRKGKKN